MNLRLVLLATPVAVALSLGTLVPAEATPPGAVTGLTASAVQTPGSHDSWTVSASWSDNVETSYTVVIADQETGGNAYVTKASAGSPASITTDALVGDHDFWVRVQPEGGAVATTTFHTPVLDATAPSGVFHLDRASAYLVPDPLSGTEKASFAITQQSADPFTSRTVLAGDGSAAAGWTSGSSFTLHYTKAGTYHPIVQLTDEFANTASYALPAVRVLKDVIAPTVRIKTPARPGKIASWHRALGTVSDVGTGVAGVLAFVMEKRGSTWWAYDFSKKRWLKGYPSAKKTENKSKAAPALIYDVRHGAWKTPVIKSLTKGTLRVAAVAVDNAFNLGTVRRVTHAVR